MLKFTVIAGAMIAGAKLFFFTGKSSF